MTPIQRRVERAAATVQRRLRTTFALEVEALPTSAGYILEIERTDRGKDDPENFFLRYNADLCAAMTRIELLDSVLHEIVHALWWPFYESATSNTHLTPQARREILRVFEACTYRTERAFAPHVFRRRKR